MKSKFDVSKISIANDGLVILGDEELLMLEGDYVGGVIAGTSNGNCTNPNCTGQTNDICRNSLACDQNTNSTCTNERATCTDKDVSTDQ